MLALRFYSRFAFVSAEITGSPCIIGQSHLLEVFTTMAESGPNSRAGFTFVEIY